MRSTLPMTVNIGVAIILSTSVAMADSCTEKAEHMRAAVEADIPIHRVAEEVGKKLIADLEKAIDLCKSGKTTQGEQIIQRISKTFGYH